MKVSRKLFLLIIFAIIMSIAQFMMHQVFNYRLEKLSSYLNSLTIANDYLMQAIAEEKKFLQTHHRQSSESVIKLIRAACLEISNVHIDSKTILSSDLEAFEKLLVTYHETFIQLSNLIAIFDHENQVLNNRLYDFHQFSIAIIKQARQDIGYAMINVENIDENIRSLSDTAKDTILWIRQINLSLNQDLFVQQNEAIYQKRLTEILKELQNEGKNINILSNYFSKSNYATYLSEAKQIIEWLPTISDRLYQLWKEKQQLDNKLDQIRLQILSIREKILSTSKLIHSDLKKTFLLYDLIGFLFILVMLSWGGYKISKSISVPLYHTIKDLNATADHTSSLAGVASQNSQVIAQISSEQAASIEEISSSLEQISAMCKQSISLTKGAELLMNENIQKSGKTLKSLVDLTKCISEIEADSDQMGLIIKTINEISFQTNLLALNAAVEAARAGEIGSGFTVVADEVRNLALRSAKAADQTQQLLKKNIERVIHVASEIKTINNDFEGIIESATILGEKTNAITLANTELTQGLEQITVSAHEIDKITQQLATIGEEAFATSEDLNGQVEKMRTVVDVLIKMVAGKKGLIQKNQDISISSTKESGSSPAKDSDSKTESQTG